MHIFCSMLSNWACQSVNTYLLGVYVVNQANPFPEFLLLSFQAPIVHTEFLIEIFFFGMDLSTLELQEGRQDFSSNRILLLRATSTHLRIDNLPCGYLSVNSTPSLFCFFCLFVCLFGFCFLGPHPQQKEVPRLGVELEL